ncbi:hypothetical protein [Anditalea andensis]|nr:hypothetical protein [Anditalea andensis]
MKSCRSFIDFTVRSTSFMEWWIWMDRPQWKLRVVTDRSEVVSEYRICVG